MSCAKSQLIGHPFKHPSPKFPSRSIEGRKMQRVNEFVFYELAVQIHQLTELRLETKYSEVWYQWSQSRDALDEIYRQRPLNFTTPVALRLYNAITAVVPKEWDAMVAKFPKKTATGVQEEEANILPWLGTE